MPARRRAGCTLYLTIAFTRGIWAFTTRTNGCILQEITYLIVHQCRVIGRCHGGSVRGLTTRASLTATHVECAHCNTLQHTGFTTCAACGWAKRRNGVATHIDCVHCNTLQHAATFQLHHLRCVAAGPDAGIVWLPHCQHTATHCNTLQHAATRCNTLQHAATHCNTKKHAATIYLRLTHIPSPSTTTHGNTLQHTTTQYSTLQHAATRCNTLQHTATHYNTLQHICPQLTHISSSFCIFL